MSGEILRIPDAAPPPEDGRFDRFRLIEWWDQEKLARAKILVVGAGALGNELVKNLVLLGVGNLVIADLDAVENSNLSRSILYRERDNGQPKAKVAAAAAREIFPQINVSHFHGDVIHDLGLGVFRWADVVLAGLDNREARLAINRYCWKVNRPWIDGAIETIQGWVRFFQPEGPCYECTMSERDWEILKRRRSCNLLTRDEMERGRTPTTPTISSIIAGVQCQEALKHLHGLPTMRGRGWVFEGFSGDSYQVEYQQNDQCYSHERLDAILPLDAGAATLTAREALAVAEQALGGEAELELAREMVEKFVCPECKAEEPVFAPLGRVFADRAACPSCPQTRREAVTFYKVHGDEPFLDRPLAEIGVPPFDIVFARRGERLIGLELTRDERLVLQPAVCDEGAIAWS